MLTITTVETIISMLGVSVFNIQEDATTRTVGVPIIVAMNVPCFLGIRVTATA
jgi:hypothetical protein